MNMDMAGLAGMMMGLQGGAGCTGAQQWMSFGAPMAAPSLMAAPQMAAPQMAATPMNFEAQLRKFLETYPMDERALEFLIQTPEDIRQKVIENFDPKNKAETDYSRQVTSYIRSQTNRKRTREEEENPFASFDKRPKVEESPGEEDLNMFRLKYPMDDRAFEFLFTSPPAALKQVLSEFRPRTEGEADYSSLVTSMVKRARQACGASIPTSQSFFSSGGLSHGPSPEQLQEFRRRYPMDERAWEYLMGVPGNVQHAVLVEFRPKREDDSDHSAPVTAFVRAKSSRLGIHPPSSGLPSAGGSAGQSDLAALTQILESPGVNQLLKNGGLSQLLQVVAQADAAWEQNSAQMNHGGDSQMAGRLQAFRQQYPMDDRAFEFLSLEDPAVQDAFLSQFRPKREGESDYSGAVTSYLRNVKSRMPAYGGGGKPGGATPSFGGEMSGLLQALGGGGGGGGPLEAFRARYPMDDRAWDFLTQQESAVQEIVLSEFCPKREGDPNYSGAVTSYVKTAIRKVASAAGGSAGGMVSAMGGGMGNALGGMMGNAGSMAGLLGW